MNRSGLFFWLIAVVILSNSCKKDSLNNDCISYPIPSDTYKYPIVPGTPAWANLQNGSDRLQACQLPDSLLKRISTEGLVQSWLDFPMLIELHLTNSYQKSIEFFVANFSGLKELCKRKNAADKLLEKYQSMNPACVTSYQTDIEQGGFTLAFAYIELPLAQDTIINKMTLEQKKALVSEALKKYNTRLIHQAHYDQMTSDLSLFICAKVMLNCQYQPFINNMNSDLIWFSNYGRFSIPVGDYTAERNIILSYSTRFLL